MRLIIIFSGFGTLENYDEDSLEDEDDVLDDLSDDASDNKKDDNNIYKDSVRRFLLFLVHHSCN